MVSRFFPEGEKPVVKECIFDKKNCQDWRDSGSNATGIYEIFIPELGMKKVKCEMTIEGGGWIIMQER